MNNKEVLQEFIDSHPVSAVDNFPNHFQKSAQAALDGIDEQMNELRADLAAVVEALRESSEIMRAYEWQTHHDAKNTYCPYCSSDDDWWEDQKEHHEGCSFVDIRSKVSALLARLEGGTK